MEDTSVTASSYIEEKLKETICIYCKSENAVKYGKRHCKKGVVQIYFCKSCSRRFTPKDGFRRMKHDKKIITMALDCYAKGMSLRGVRQHLRMFYSIEISHVGVLYWIRKYKRLIKTYADTLKLKSEKLYADETVVVFNKRENYLWNVMDAKSRFWITGNLSLFKNQNSANRTFEKTKSMLLEEPLIIATDGAFAYLPAIKSIFDNAQHFRYTKPEDKPQMQIMERLNGNIKQRTKVMRGMWCARTAREIIELWQIYYNFVRPHSALHNRTPAEVAGLVPHWTDNKWERLIELGDSNEN